MENIVWKIRTWMYVIAIVVFCLINLCRGAQAFWPPDMVPHPTPPWDEPKQPNDPVDC